MTPIAKNVAVVQSPLCGSNETSRSILNSLSAHIAIIDADGAVLDTNVAWRRFAQESGMPAGYDSIGENYLKICEAAAASGDTDAGIVAAGIRRVIEGDTAEFLHAYPCHSVNGQHWFYLRAIRIAGEDPVRVIVSHEEITALKRSEEALRQSEERLKQQKHELEEANIALKVLLKQRENDKAELERKVIANVKDSVMPYLEKLKRMKLSPRTKTLLEIVDANLQGILSPMIQTLANANIILTPQEIQVATLVKEGKTSKEIAEILNVSDTTVNFHRKNLRRKLGLSNRQTNLRSYLLSIP